MMNLVSSLFGLFFPSSFLRMSVEFKLCRISSMVIWFHLEIWGFIATCKNLEKFCGRPF